MPHQHEVPHIDPEVLVGLSKLQPYRSFFSIFFDWLVIVLSILICIKVSYWFYLPAFILIGSRFHALEGMMHEAAHYRIHPNKKINDFIGELIVWPIGLSLTIYRKLIHLDHHKYIGSNLDSHKFIIYDPQPELYDLPLTKKKLLTNSLKAGMMFPNHLFKMYRLIYRVLPKFSSKYYKYWLAFQLSLIIFLVLGSVLISYQVAVVYILFFILPHFWTAAVTNYLRLLAEHFGIQNSSHDVALGGETRTIRTHWFFEFFFWPHMLNYHQEHHWFPSIPYYNLPKLHQWLWNNPEARSMMNVTFGVNQLINEITTDNQVQTRVV